jgi:hypothetical protein
VQSSIFTEHGHSGTPSSGDEPSKTLDQRAKAYQEEAAKAGRKLTPQQAFSEMMENDEEAKKLYEKKA